MIIDNKKFEFNKKTYVWGIINVTPDSFFDGGKNNSIDSIINLARQMIQDGVSIIDIGGESTRPNFTPISLQDELNRVIPAIEAIKKEFKDIIISIDTYKAEVARLALQAGASIVNDVYSLQKDVDMANVLAQAKCPCCFVHNKPIFDSNNVIDSLIKDLDSIVNNAIKYGIDKDNIIIDPGIGFNKTQVQNLDIIKNLKRLKELGLPVLLATSNKSVFGLASLEKNERDEATIATTVLAAMSKIEFVRVHNVKGNVNALKFCNMIFD